MGKHKQKQNDPYPRSRMHFASSSKTAAATGLSAEAWTILRRGISSSETET